jgi:exopolysaccharide biosynthesis WecB/TagA/CpsF family protein
LTPYPPSDGASSLGLPSSALDSTRDSQQQFPQEARRDTTQRQVFPRPAELRPDQQALRHRANPYSDVPSLFDLYSQYSGRSVPLQRFGADIFRTGTGNFDELPMDLPVGPEYVLGPGDGLNVELWGAISQRLQRVVDRQGRVALPEVGAVQVSGRSLGDVQTFLQGVHRTQFRDVQADVSLSRLRTVRVYVVGDVERAGAYDVSALSRLQGHSHMRRVFGPDLMMRICERSQTEGYKHFLYGGEPDVAPELQARLQRRFPRLRIVGTYTPPFRPFTPAEETEVVDLVNQVSPDILWVGLSTPKQERFMAEYSPKLNAKLMIGVGAAFDYHTGRIKDASDWVKHAGLQWLHRLAQDPRRLWKRYLFNIPPFLLLAAAQLVGLKKYPELWMDGSEPVRTASFAPPGSNRATSRTTP